MKTSKAIIYFVSLQGAVLLAGLFAAASTAHDDKTIHAPVVPAGPVITSLKGEDIYRAYCASCHGMQGKGDGPVAPALNSKIPDLTGISSRNGGIFPTARVHRIISGDASLTAHGSREMPIWGPLFHQIQSDRDYGEVRMQNITDYLKKIQK